MLTNRIQGKRIRENVVLPYLVIQDAIAEFRCVGLHKTRVYGKGDDWNNKNVRQEIREVGEGGKNWRRKAVNAIALKIIYPYCPRS